MVVDTSVLVALAMREPGHLELRDRLESADEVLVAAPTLVETHVVLRHKVGDDGDRILAALMRRFAITPVPFRSDHATVAAEAFDRYGKGRHPARLNLGDLFAYAVARRAEDTLLFVGDDFALTDVRRVSP